MGSSWWKKLWWFGVAALVVGAVLIGRGRVVYADELEEIEKQIAELSRARQMSIEATKPLEAELSRLEEQIKTIETRLEQARIKLGELEESIKERERRFEEQYAILAERVAAYYRRMREPAGVYFLLTGKSVAEVVRDLVYKQAAADEDKRIIAQIAEELVQLEADKKKVEEDRVRLASLQKKLDKEAEFFRGEIAGAKAYQEELAGKIAELTRRQQELLAEKTGLFSTSVGEVPLADDPAARPDYDPGFRPAFAAFSFGAPHFKGLSQYGALGRAKSGQSWEEILRAYYGDVRIETVDTNLTIHTDQGDKSFEDDYLKGIAEMPSRWGEEGGFEALKAQAVAARSYALAYVGWRMGNRVANGRICTNEHCQVYRASRVNDPAADAWHRAVEETRGKILVSNQSGEVVNAWYASTSGGYQESYSSLRHTTPAFWDTRCGSQSCWTAEAYEKIAGSPWFYKGWYKSRSGKSCGRSHPWLTEEEMADILNALIVYTHDGSSGPHLSQVDAASCWGEIPETWSKEKVRQEAAKYGGPVSRINDVSVVYSNAGVTAKVRFETDKGVKEFEGGTFYKVFNLRAPGVIHLKSGLFNIEVKR